MKVYDILMICGVPALISTFVVFIISKIKTKYDNKTSQQDNLAAGMQIMLRLELISLAEKYLAKGYCTVEEKELFTAVYNAYHNLGKNGVMNDLYNRVLSLPVSL